VPAPPPLAVSETGVFLSLLNAFGLTTSDALTKKVIMRENRLIP